ncbi:MAG: hypothetical protein MUE60_11850, partial [Candidatus Eisenbacteria bacterium]|nr:hypothetical protein [Candidatus Eisenbacteria bacterium]
IMVAPGQILQLAAGTEGVFTSGAREFRLQGGAATLHAATVNDSLRVWLATTTGEIRCAASGLRVMVNGVQRHLQHGEVIRGESTVASGGRWLRRDGEDGRYLLDLLQQGEIPSPDYSYRFPSTRPGFIRQSVQGYGGVATYRGNRYYLAEFTYRLRAWHLQLAYDLWFAVDRRGRLYSKAWDEWKDLVDHVDHLQLFVPGDPVFLRLGHIDRLSYGRGLLLESYTNAVFIPFERRTGLQAHVRMADLTVRGMVNDVARPRIIGGSATWIINPRFDATLTYVGDVDQYSNIADGDGDSYPDAVDPLPDVANTPQDSIIQALRPVRLDSIPPQTLHGIAASFDHVAARVTDAELRLAGEVAFLSSIGSGISFPELVLRYRGVTVGAGLDFQTPRFSTSIFDRTYELDKARFIIQPDSSLLLVSRGHDLPETDAWLYGWNNSVSLQISEDLMLRTRFRDVTRGSFRNKLFSLSVEASLRFLSPITRAGAFIEQKNVSRLLQERTDGEIWGGEIRMLPHESTQIRVRYRERYGDSDRSASIEEDEVDRSFSASMTIDGSYWWARFQAWRENRSKPCGKPTHVDVEAR